MIFVFRLAHLFSVLIVYMQSRIQFLLFCWHILCPDLLSSGHVVDMFTNAGFVYNHFRMVFV